jgi:predicted GTPase
MGAASRDFNVVFRDDPHIRGAAFTAAQIPGIENRVYAIASGLLLCCLLWLEKRRFTLNPLLERATNNRG